MSFRPATYSTSLFVAAVIGIPLLLYTIVQWYGQRHVPLPVLGGASHRIQAFTLTDQQGKKADRTAWQHKIVVADFFFTHCPGICPKMTYNLKRVQAYAGIDDLLLASFSVDPERDSVTRLQQYARKMGIAGNWQLLTGPKREIYRLARKSFLITATDGDGGPDDFIHSDNLVLIDRRGRIRGFYPGTREDAVNQLVKDIRKLAREQ